MRYGNLQRRWQEAMPKIYDKETRIVCLDITSETQADESGAVKDGYSFIPIEIDSHIDYGHIKSQLIEAGYPQKEEFGLLMNAVDDIINAIMANSTITSIKSALATDDVNTFRDFCLFRTMCAEAAKEVMSCYTL